MDKRRGTGITSMFTILILGMLNFLLLWLIFPRNGAINLAKFMNPSYKWIIYITLGLLLFFMFSEIRNLFNRRAFSSSGGVSRTLTVLSLSVPLLFFLAAKDTYLTADMKNLAVIRTDPAGTGNGLRESSGGAPAEGDGGGTQNPFLTESSDPENAGSESPRQSKRDGGKETSLLTIFEDRDNYLGKRVNVVGMAHTFSELGNDKLFLYRLMVACCAADAQPLGLIVQVDSLESIESNRWYRAEGVVTMVKVENQGDEPFLGLIAEDLRETEEPDFPFLF